jgi:hypothetical protein
VNNKLERVWIRILVNWRTIPDICLGILTQPQNVLTATSRSKFEPETCQIHSKSVTCFTTMFSQATYSLKPLIPFQNLNIYINNSFSTQHSSAASVSNSTTKEITRKKFQNFFFHTVITITITNMSIHTLTDN